MSWKSNIIVGFIIYWVYELSQYRKKVSPPMDRFRFPDFK
jgi:hypothetical protein